MDRRGDDLASVDRLPNCRHALINRSGCERCRATRTTPCRRDRSNVHRSDLRCLAVRLLPHDLSRHHLRDHLRHLTSRLHRNLAIRDLLLIAHLRNAFRDLFGNIDGLITPLIDDDIAIGRDRHVLRDSFLAILSDDFVAIGRDLLRNHLGLNHWLLHHLLLRLAIAAIHWPLAVVAAA